MTQTHFPRLPLKSVAGALLFSVFLGPVGLLYATPTGGVVMIVLAIAIFPTKLPVPLAIVWLGSCIWSVVAVNRFNQKWMRKFYKID